MVVTATIDSMTRWRSEGPPGGWVIGKSYFTLRYDGDY
jgi:hypothetical protein